MLFLISLIWGFNCDYFPTKIEHAINGLESPQALPNDNFELTKTYGTFYLKNFILTQ